MSSSEEDSGTESFQRKRRRKQHNEAFDSSPSSNSTGSPVIKNKHRVRGQASSARNVIEDSYESESDSSIEVQRRRKVQKVISDEEDSSGSDIVKTSRKTPNVISESEIDSSDWETDSEAEDAKQNAADPSAVDFDSDFSDGQSEKCPICLLSIRTQELGTPESCDHIFCVECIQEWSKNMNTCPVDRQEYNLILVRKKIGGKIIRQIPIEKPQNEVEIVEDPTFCEVCGSSEGEDRMLLCDGCDLGFHLQCLTPPLEEVPAGAWFCADCSPEDVVNQEIDFFEVQFLLDDAEADIEMTNGRRRHFSPRLIPRTRQSERVRTRIVTNRQNRSTANMDQPATSSNAASNAERSTVSSTTRKKPLKKKSTKKKAKKSRKTKTRKRYTVRYEVDPVTGETIEIVKVKRRRTKKKKTRRQRPAAVPKTVKKRLALQLGICNPKQPSQLLPDVRISNAGNKINNQRWNAGIPTLHIYGNRDSLEYFSGSDDEEIGDSGLGLLTRRRAPTHSDLVAFRRLERRKAIHISSTTPAVSSSTDLLDSILDAQTKLYSKNTILEIGQGGTIKMKMDENKNGAKLNNNINNLVRKAPGYQNNSSNRPNNFCTSSNSVQSNNSYGGGSVPNYAPTSTTTSGSAYQGGDDEQSAPQDYTHQNLCSLETSLMDPESNAQKSDSEVDIYSDIESETVSTSKAGNEPKLPENEEYDPELAEIGREGSEDDNDSESNMVIDTEKVEAPLDEYDDETSQEEATVSSSIDTRNAVNSPVANYTAPSILHSTYDDKNMRFDEDDFDLDGCPNFCIYSSESMNMAKHTDVTGNNSAVQNDQVEEITSTPVDAESLMPDDRPFEEHEHPEECTSTPVEPEESTVKENEPLEISSTPLDAENVPKDTTCEAEEQLENIVWPEEDKDITSNENPSQEPEAADQEARNVITNADVSVEQEPEERALPPPLDGEEPNKKQDKEPKTPEITPVVSSKILDNSKSKKTALDSVGLYSDSDDEAVVNKKQTSFTDICNMTEDISEEERSYTPCLDENVPKQGLDGLDTEMISDEEKNDFEESQERDGDALEINAKESELDLARPEDFEDGEIFEMFKSAAESILKESYEDEGVEAVAIDLEKLPDKKVTKEVRKESKKTNKEAKKSNKENTKDNKENKKEDKEPTKEKEPKKDSNANTSTDSSFKKLSRSNKDRNYRDKENKTRQRARSNSRENENKENKKRKKRKEIERYDVRALMADKPRRTTDKFGRDVRDSASKSKSKSPPRTPPPRDRTPSPITRRSLSKNRNRSPSLTRRSPSIRRSLTPLRNRSPSPTRLRNRSPSMTPPRRRSPSLNASRRTPPRQRRRSLSRKHRSPSPVKARKRGNRSKVARSVSRSPVRKRSGKRRRSPTPEKRRKTGIKKTKSGKKRIGSRRRSRSPTPTGRLRVPQWSRRDPRDSPTHSTSRSPGPRNPSPSWTPPRLLDTVNPHNLTVILANDQLKKKALRKKKEKRLKDAIDKASKKRRKNRPSPPAKEVYASGDNILVSVSYNKENETRAVTTRDVISTSNRRQEDEPPPKKKRKEKAKRPKEGKRKKKNTLDLTNVKPVAIIDLDLSPFKEITPSPKDVIVLSDSENERETIEQRVLQQEICDSSQVPSSPERIDAIYTTGPKTPPEPQIKFALPSNKPQLRTVNPLIDPAEIELELLEAQNATNDDERLPDSVHIGPNTPPDPPNSAPSSPDAYDPFEPTKSRSPSVEPLESAQTLEETSTIETSKEKPVVVNETLSLTPPMAEVQPADSQSSIHATPESSTPSKSPGEHPIGVIINQQVQPAKPIAQTTPFSSTASLVTSTPVSASAASRINILNSTILSVAATIPQRIVLPNIIKSSPIKISPVKATTLKSSPIKPMPAKPKLSLTPRKSRTDKESETNIDLDSPYSPGSSDYEDLFEPPSEIVTKPNLSKVTTSATKPSAKVQSAFDTLFGTPFKNLKKSYDKTTSAKAGKVSTPIKIKGGTKTVGVKLDEDHLKILDELPNSAVEMQVKDKFLKKLNRQERVVEEVKLVLKPHYNKKHVTKEEYKDILRKAVPKICHNKSGEINPTKIKHLVEAYVKKIKHSKKVTSSSSVNQKS